MGMPGGIMTLSDAAGQTPNRQDPRPVIIRSRTVQGDVMEATADGAHNARNKVVSAALDAVAMGAREPARCSG